MLEIVRAIGPDSPAIRDLADRAADEGFTFLNRTLDEWDAGTNRFDQVGESFYIARRAAVPVGACGINVDPYVDDPNLGRLRHLYVHPDHRRTGIASRLVHLCLATPTPFTRVRLRTTNSEAARFYQSIGFQPTTEPGATHTMALTPPALMPVQD